MFFKSIRELGLKYDFSYSSQLNATVGPLDWCVLYGRMSMICGPTVTFN